MRCHERAGEFLDPSDTLALRSPFIRKKLVWEDLASRREVAKCHECFEAKREKGERGARGERGVPGARGPKGKPAPQITAWKIDRERYRAVPIYTDGKPGPAIELRDLFAQFLNEVGQSGQ
jgi:hypothetical protein